MFSLIFRQDLLEFRIGFRTLTRDIITKANEYNVYLFIGKYSKHFNASLYKKNSISGGRAFKPLTTFYKAFVLICHTLCFSELILLVLIL